MDMDLKVRFLNTNLKSWYCLVGAMKLSLLYGRVCKWLKQADCKSVPIRFNGSNPFSPTILYYILTLIKNYSKKKDFLQV